MINAINSNISTNTYLDTIKRKVDSKNIDFERLLEKEDSYKSHEDKYTKTYTDTNLHEASNIYTCNGTETNTDSKSNDVETKSDIIVKSDGSRVLVITTNVGGMETTMSLELSKPTNMLNTENDYDEKHDVLNSHEDVSPILKEGDEVLINENK